LLSTEDEVGSQDAQESEGEVVFIVIDFGIQADETSTPVAECELSVYGPFDDRVSAELFADGIDAEGGYSEVLPLTARRQDIE
jgi:hypothetical protein